MKFEPIWQKFTQTFVSVESILPIGRWLSIIFILFQFKIPIILII